MGLTEDTITTDSESGGPTSSLDNSNSFSSGVSFVPRTKYQTKETSAMVYDVNWKGSGIVPIVQNGHHADSEVGQRYNANYAFMQNEEIYASQSGSSFTKLNKKANGYSTLLHLTRNAGENVMIRFNTKTGQWEKYFIAPDQNEPKWSPLQYKTGGYVDYTGPAWLMEHQLNQKHF